MLRSWQRTNTLLLLLLLLLKVQTDVDEYDCANLHVCAVHSHTYMSSAEYAQRTPCPPCADTALTCSALSLFLQHFFTHLDPYMRDYC